MSSTSSDEERRPLYAAVVVHTGLRPRVTKPIEPIPEADDEDHLTRAFHYEVPDRLRDQAQVGQLVWVPFNRRHLQGVIVALDDQTPVDKTLEIDEIVDSEPVLGPSLVELAHWIANYYLAPLHQVMLAMLPPGVTQHVRSVVQVVPDIEVARATTSQAKLLGLLRAKGPLTTSQIARQSDLRNSRAVVRQMVHHGWVTTRVEIAPPATKPKLIPVVRAKRDLVLADHPLLRAPRQRQGLEYLCARRGDGDGWMPLSDVTAETGVTAAAIRALVDRGLAEADRRNVWRDPLRGQSFVPVSPPKLTSDQERAWESIAQDLSHPAGKPFLLQGVTGSGKTEIYLRAVARTLSQGRGAIILVPEISLTPQTIRRFGARFPTTIAVWHSRLSAGERFDQWRRMRAGELRLVIGSRSALFAPIRDLGLIVLDEEHEWTYKQQRSPRYHARDAAVQLARLVGATCVLGSATPSLSSRYRAERGEYVHVLMPQRIMGHRRVLHDQAVGLSGRESRYRALEEGPEEAMYIDLPPVQVVDMRAELRAGNTSVFSRALRRAIDVALAAGEQVILFLNRRGSATFVMCRDCGHVLKCPRCELPLTYHSAVDDLICHHCNHTTFLPPQCPSCWSGRIKFFGLGTQRLEELVNETWPLAQSVRWDTDTTGKRGDHEAILDRFIGGEADIMVGTQMIAKGLDLPRVTLVGVVTADTIINLPDYTSGERTFQLLTQVAGRAGRSVLGGKVIIQTYTPHHPAIQASMGHDYEGFYQGELAFRRDHWYPPVSQLIQLVYVHSNEDQARREAEGLHRILILKIARLGLPQVDLIGPAPAFFSRLRGKWRWQIILRGQDPAALLRDMHPPLGWRIDVDPASLL